MSEDTVTLLAAAKINLSLDILGKREDGYHLMQMVMQSVSLYDTIVVTTGYTPGITLTCQQPGVPNDARNIAWKAAQLFLSVHRQNSQSAYCHYQTNSQ